MLEFRNFDVYQKFGLLYLLQSFAVGGLLMIVLDSQGMLGSSGAHLAEPINLSLYFSVWAVLVVGTLIAYILMARAIRIPLQATAHVMNTVADGDLAAEFDNEGRDEAAQLMKAMSAMVGGLKAMVNDISLAAQGVTLAASEINAGNFQASRRNEMTVLGVQKTKIEMEGLISSVSENTKSAELVSALTDDSTKTTNSANNTIRQMATGMQVVSKLSSEVSEFVSTIDKLAFQTNLLALNAAVEAARAGDSGRGFAVVASEVRGLANRSAHAAREIRSLAERSAQHIMDVMRQADEATETMQRMTRSAHDMNLAANSVLQASQRQSVGLSAIAQTVGEFEASAQQGASLAEEASAAAQSLNDLAVSLQAQVQRFSLEPRQVPGSVGAPQFH